MNDNRTPFESDPIKRIINYSANFRNYLDFYQKIESPSVRHQQEFINLCKTYIDILIADTDELAGRR